MKFDISKKEMDRRVKAYTTLILSFLISLILLSCNYIVQHLNISLFIIFILTAFLLGSRIVLIRYFNSLMKDKTILTPKYIERNNNKYFIKDIIRINVKRTSNGYVREIKLGFNNKKTIYINNEIDNIDKFEEQLQKYLSKKVLIKYIVEPLDYDHPLFYFFFGVLVSFVFFIFSKFLITLDINKINIFNYIVSIISIVFGLYFVIYKPINKRGENKNSRADYLWGVIFILIGTVMFIVKLIYR